ncbi:S8 family serine peptidase [Natrinema halophilum]|uniref:S8 family serine peptidase n=1 Tax=Natrinema halophilum TaxID=1699371 RepID=A0A7D5KR00_9EURY|nr:S8 family serine peptidase [Natrinema halophilum]QLG47944.1 S8 family serine peptidase [Natrinema halophilum]
MTQKDPPDRDGNDRTYDRRSILSGAGSIAIGGLLGLSDVTTATPGREPGPKSDEIIVGLSPSVSNVAHEAHVCTPEECEVAHANEAIRYATVSVPSDGSDRNREQLIESIRQSPAVKYAESNATVQSLLEPNDPQYGSQHAPQQVNCEQAWETTRGSQDVVISVVDQGVQYDHPALEGVVDDRIGEDFVDNDGDPYPGRDEFHGTHVAGIATGGTDDGTGHAGISDCSMLSVRALDQTGQGAITDVADAIQWSADADADIINLSLGVQGSFQTLRSACQYAADRGVLLVGAAGNQGVNRVFSPASEETVLAVSALNSDDSLASFSNTGPEIDLAAPGNQIVSSVTGGDYARLSGTSMAAPVVSGVAGLALSAHSGLSRSELRQHLLETAADVGLSDAQQGAGRVDAAAAVQTDPSGDGDPGDGTNPDEDTNQEDGGPDENENGENPSGQCGNEILTARTGGTLDGRSWWGESHRYGYSLRTADPCSATITLEGPADGDFELYVTTDGRSPSRWDHDESATNSGSSGSVDLSLDGVDILGLQIHAERGAGQYTLQLEERGR